MRIPIHIQQELPGVATAFDESSMRGHLQAALFGAARPGFTVERCTPNKPLYVPGECCTVQYEFEARDSASGALQARTVVGRVFPDAASCAGYMSDKLTPLVQWVEQGTAPERIVGSRIVNGRPARTRPLCPYPQVAKYNGSGSIDEAANFTCTAPAAK